MSLILTVSEMRDRLTRRVCPIFGGTGSRDLLKTPRQVGSGVLFRFNQCSLLITALHVCDEGGGHLWIRTPGESHDSTFFERLPYPPWAINSPGFEKADVACIPIPIRLADRVGRMCEYVEPEELGHIDEEVPGTSQRYVLIGFPSSRNKQGVIDPNTGRARSAWRNVALVTELRQRLPEEFASRHGKAPTAHFALEAAVKVTPLNGGPPVKAPDLNGMSGGGIWKIHVHPQTQLVERSSLAGIFIERENVQGRIALIGVRTDWAKDYRTWWQAGP